MSKQKDKTQMKSSRSLADILETWLGKHERRLAIGILILSAAFALVLFDTKLSTGGDDAAYVLQARNMVFKGAIPLGFRVPGYPIVLSLFVLIDKASVVVLKFSSLLFFVGAVSSFYFIFRGRLKRLVLFAAMALLAINGLALEYAHHTYSEMLYLLVQLWAIHFFLKSEESESHRWRNVALAVVFGMLAFYVRVIGFTLLVAMGIVWLLKREWKIAATAVALSALLYLPLKIAERASGAQSMQQASILFLANPYNPTQGNETLGGFAERMWNNFLVHAQYMIPRSLGLPYSDELAQADGRVLPNGMALLALLVTCVVIAGMVRTVRERASGLRGLSLYVAVYLTAIFFLLHTVYATPRMMVPLVPFVAILFLLGVQSVTAWLFRKNSRHDETTKRWTVVAIVLTLISNGVYLSNEMSRNIPVLKENLRGNEFYGYSADWVNYLNACKWVRANLQKDSVGIICRKPEMLQVYAGDFLAHGVYQVESTDPDTIVANWRRWNMTHLLYDNFQWSATLRRYVQPVAQKYPKIFELIHQEGEAAPSFIYRLNLSEAVNP